MTSIILGAFGAHYFSEILTPKRLKSFVTGVNYLMYMGLGLCVIYALKNEFTPKALKVSMFLISLGTLLFSGSIFILVYLGHHDLQNAKQIIGPITPVGGLLMICGWFYLVIQSFLKKVY